jgi:hypothetical protein
LYYCGWGFNGKLVRVVKRKIPVFLSFCEKNTGILDVEAISCAYGYADGGVDLPVGFNDTFFMSLMFFLSGLFVLQSVQAGGLDRS